MDANLTRLLSFLHQPRTFAPGRMDCGLVVADWIRDVTGEDVASEHRGKYDDLLSMFRYIGSHGSLLEMTRQSLSRFLKTDDPAVGDVGVLFIPGNPPLLHYVPAIASGWLETNSGGLYRRWVFASHAGFIARETEAVEAWSIMN